MKSIKPFILTLIFFLAVWSASCQVYITRNGTISFFSEAPLENIQAVNNQVSSALDIQTGEFVFRVIMRAFSFEKALMQEHFNDNFVESHLYPNATFEGRIIETTALEERENEEVAVTVEGNLTIKDVTRRIRETGSLSFRNGRIIASSVFMIRPEDYNISIPLRFVRNIAEEIEVTVNLNLTERE